MCMSTLLCSACARRRGTATPSSDPTSATPVSSHDDSTPRMFIDAVYEAHVHVVRMTEQASITSSNHNSTHESTQGIPWVGKNSLHVRPRSHYAAFPCRAIVLEMVAKQHESRWSHERVPSHRLARTGPALPPHGLSPHVERHVAPFR